jgi:hypothetical protein
MPSAPYIENTVCSPWATVAEFRSRYVGTGVSDDVIDAALVAATDALFTLSGRQFPGVCTAEVRPFGGDTETHANLSEVDIGLWPIVEVTEVLVDGVVIDPSEYRVDENRYLVRLAGPGPQYAYRPWPLEQELGRPKTAPATFSVTVRFGVDPPGFGKIAALALAAELVAAHVGDDCVLPERITNIARQGITMQVTNPNDLLVRNRTGIYEVDRFLMVYNPTNMQSPAFVFSPDTQPRQRRYSEFPYWYTGRSI